MNHFLKTGALYIRVSTDKQEELSPDAQIRECLSFAEKNQIQIPADYIFRDDGISGRNAEKRPAFQNLIGLAKSKEHPIACIIVWKFSRFARNQEESIVYKSLLKKNCVDVLSVSEPLIDGPFGTLIERIIEWMDEYYSIRLSGEVMRGMTENALRGNYQADPPIGYRYAAGLPPQKDTATAPIVTSCVKWLLEEHLTLRQIAVRLNAMGYQTKRGNIFEPRSVRYLLENPFYAGKVRWNYSGRSRILKPDSDVIYADGNWEALYSYDTYQRIQERLKELDSRNQCGKKRDLSACRHWLCGSLVCSSCGKTLTQIGADKNKGFQCWAYTKGMCAESHYISLPRIETYVLAGLEQLLASDTVPYSLLPVPSVSEDKITELHRMLSHLNDRQRRAKDAYLNQIDSLEEYKENRAQIASERSRLQTELEQLRSDALSEDSDAGNIQTVSEVLNILKNDTVAYSKKGIALRSIVDKIVFDRKNTTLHFYLHLVK